MTMIHEAILTTLDEQGQPHITPLGYRWQGQQVLLAPFVPSRTEANLRHGGEAVVNLTDDVRIFAGCLTGRRDWPLQASEQVAVPRLAGSLSHLELKVAKLEDDELRPRFLCDLVHRGNHRPYEGFNRAQAAVIEAAILVSRLHMLDEDKIRREREYLTIAIDKTAGEAERQAWDWLMERIDAHQPDAPVRAGGN